MVESTEVCNFANSTTFFAREKGLNYLINTSKHGGLLAIEWFGNKYMKLNREKSHLLVLGNKSEHIWTEIEHSKVWESPKQKLLGVVIDRDLSFDGCVSSLCSKAGKKLSALVRLSH